MKHLPFLILIFLLPSLLKSQESDVIHTIDSKYFQEERIVYVYLPETYFSNQKDTFMVTYVLDAQSPSFWKMVKQNISFLVDNYQAVPMIIVGIHTINRQSEFIPLPKDREINENIPGTAHLLQSHFEEEIFPLIESNYRVNSHRAIIGHSKGGGFVNHTLFSNKFELFDAYIGISPAMGFWNNQILEDADSVLNHRSIFNKFLYASYGDIGSYEYTFSDQVDRLDRMIRKANNSTLGFHKAYFKGTDHWSTVIPSLNNSILNMSREYWVDQKILEEFAENEDLNLKSQIEQFYRDQNLKYGYTVLPDVRILLFIGNDFGELGNEQRALETYLWGLEIDPENVSINRNIAWVYKQKKDYIKSNFYYQQALTFLELMKPQLKEADYKQMKQDINQNIKKIRLSKS